MTLVSSDVAVTNEIDVESLRETRLLWFRSESESERSVHLESQLFDGE